ncbi:hypothetical protein ACI2IY_14060 [Lysobacter enzymogenes]|uniref:hypothetical protein n=1 Tax=Lysobacter enzymogenes TaxID=69 RepID=UPI00384B52AB
MTHPELDLSTPENALHALEDACRNGDRELALRCRNFEHEAELLLHHPRARGNAPAPPAQAAPADIAQALEREWRQTHLPDFLGVSTSVAAVEHFGGKFFLVTQNVRNADGRTYSQRLYMSHAEAGWAVLRPVPAYEPPAEAKPWWAVWR